MISERCINEMNEIVRNINGKICEEDRAYVFWCPKDFKTKGGAIREGYALYAYGGVVVIIYETNKRVTCKFITDQNYSIYFGKDWNKINQLREAIKNAKYSSSTGEKIKIDWLKEITAEEWSMIFKGYKQRAEKTDPINKTDDKLYLERERETAISTYNNDIDQMLIVAMEMYVYMPNGDNPRADMVGIRREQNGYVISFIEYKCTEGGLKGVTLREHYDDMIGYYDDAQLKKKILEYLTRKKLVEGMDWLQDIEDKDVKSEMVFLFSHVNYDKKGALKQQDIDCSLFELMADIESKNLVKPRIVYIKDEYAWIENKQE